MKIPREVVEFIEERKLGKFGAIGYLAVIFNDSGTLRPIISPRHFRLHGEDCLVFDDRFSKYIKENLEKNRNVSVLLVETLRDAYGYRLLGEAEYIESGELFEEALTNMRDLNIPVRLKGVIKIKIKQVSRLAPSKDLNDEPAAKSG